jgi:hypothetical protein
MTAHEIVNECPGQIVALNLGPLVNILSTVSPFTSVNFMLVKTWLGHFVHPLES